MSESYRDLIVWQKSMALVTDIYRATDSFPAREMYGLTNQVRRAAVGVPSDIAEGKGRISKKEYVQMLARARGSICEVQTQLEISRNLEFLATEVFTDLESKAAEVGRLLNGLITRLRRDINTAANAT
ncbi:MAG: four helix bundle protein [Thermoanaerobaculia bacterium]